MMSVPIVKINDINLYYEIHGDGESICLIPGLSNDITDYKKIIRLLSQKYKVISFDNRGAGRTDKPDIPYSISMMSEDVAELLQFLGIGQAHILGVSMGGRIATELTLQHPDKVKSLILVSTYVHRIDQNLSSCRLGILLRIPWLGNIGKKYPQPRYAVIRQRDAARDYDATERLHEINVPTLILHGKKDQFAPYRFAVEMHNKIRNSKLVTIGGGHLFLFIRSEQFVDFVIKFLGGLKLK
jgi:pimeloyl-ACP methyl ester carboxylesterase